jgi:hypothetical protein
VRALAVLLTWKPVTTVTLQPRFNHVPSHDATAVVGRLLAPVDIVPLPVQQFEEHSKPCIVQIPLCWVADRHPLPELAGQQLLREGRQRREDVWTRNRPRRWVDHSLCLVEGMMPREWRQQDVPHADGCI